VFNNFCKKYLPIYVRFWPSQVWLAIWSAPVRYEGNENLPSRRDTAWEALRITVRYGENHHELIYTIKHGVI